MNTTTDPTTAVSSNSKRIVLASAYRHERRATGRQERALKSPRKMGRFDDTEILDTHRVHRISSAEEILDE
jgi:hypothetical protein